MASNSWGNLFKITTWGESHGKAMGVVIDGCPAGLPLTEKDINDALIARAPGRLPYTSPRKEPDNAAIYSGVFEGHTTGAPISIIILNKDADSTAYEPIKHILRPGHANYTYQTKYGCFDYRGGGRASARETVCRVAAGAVAQKLLAKQQIKVFAFLKRIGDIETPPTVYTADQLQQLLNNSQLNCPHPVIETHWLNLLEEIAKKGDSIGGLVEFWAFNLPVGLGDPVYEKLTANLAKGMLSIPATKGFEIGEGFEAAQMRGEQHNDLFTIDGKMSTNHSGGTLGGITTGMPLIGRVAFKPTSSIKKPQASIDYQGKPHSFVLPANARHDPCVAIRGVPVVKAMLALALADALLMNRCAKVE